MSKCPHCGEEIHEFRFGPLIKVVAGVDEKPQAIVGYGASRQKMKNGKTVKEARKIPVIMIKNKVEE